MRLLREEKVIKRAQMQKIKIKQIRSPIGRKSNQKKILISLGLNKINRERILEDTPSIMGMIKKVKHLVKVEPKDTE
ncbi:MAG: 50S ribosomal protein L30 [Rickettsiales bacterium]|nr:50S ribosomal protein L30 [Rickettsiales bacterium]